MGGGERATRLLGRLRLDSIRKQILGFAVLAALIPAVSIAWLLYAHTRRNLVERTTGELSATTAQAAREMGLWVKERIHDLRVFTGSYEVRENLERVADGGGTAARTRLAEYLAAVRARFGDYQMLVVTDTRGAVVAASGGRAGRDPALPSLPDEWPASIAQGEPVVGDPYWDTRAGTPVVTIAVPVTTGNGQVLGALAAQLNLAGVAMLLNGFVGDGDGAGDREASVVTDSGRLLITSRRSSAELMRARIPGDAFAALVASEGERREYRGHDGRDVVGILRAVPQSGWSVVAEIPRQAAFAQVARLRNTAVAVVAVLVLGIGWLAYRLGRVVVRPLDRLTAGAATVAAGDLSVAVPVSGGGEVAYLTRVFNDMIQRLRQGREELERLSITDPLTRLYNRRHLMHRLDEEGRRARRTDRSFGLLMLDVDSFKKYNDTYGHHAGDKALAGVAAVLQACVREVDCAARYGGEEFVVVLPETSAEGAIDVAQRIRARLAQESFHGVRVTLSIGVAEFPADGETPEFALRAADAALYRAKRDGRDRVVRAVRGRFSGDVRPHDPRLLRGARRAQRSRTRMGDAAAD